MQKIEQESNDAVSARVELEGKLPLTIIFSKPKWNDLLLLGAKDFGEPVPFIGRDGPPCLAGRKILGLTIKFKGWGHNFILE